MPLHLSTDGVVTKCGWPVGELVLDGCTGDPDLFDCPECEDNLGRPYAAAGHFGKTPLGVDGVVDEEAQLSVQIPGVAVVLADPG